MSGAEGREITWEEVKKHNSTDSLWVVIDGKVYDVTEFSKEHPGGQDILLEHGGVDATEDFESVGHSADARERKKGYFIGTVVDKPTTTTTKPASSTGCCVTNSCCQLTCQGWAVTALTVALIGVGLIVAYRALRK